MATEGYLEEALELDLTQLCPGQTVLGEVLEKLSKKSKSDCPHELGGGFQVSCSTGPPSPRLCNLTLAPQVSAGEGQGLQQPGVTTRLARPFLLPLRLASEGCSCPNARERPATFLFLCP